MFDVGFWELALIAAVALIVAGPEKLPLIVRDGGRALARLRRLALQTKYEIEQEWRLDEGKKFDERIGDLDRLMDIAADKKTDTPPPTERNKRETPPTQS